MYMFLCCWSGAAAVVVALERARARGRTHKAAAELAALDCRVPINPRKKTCKGAVAPLKRVIDIISKQRTPPTDFDFDNFDFMFWRLFFFL